jgi:hypothetical protein
MIEFLALQIIMGRVTIERVPTAYREAVAARVAELQAPATAE